MRRILLAFVVGALGVACHTITEELPSRPGPINVEGAPTLAPPPPPVIVIPVPAPTPVVVDQPPNPAPNNPGGGGGNVPNNTNPAVRLGAKVFFVECGGREIPGSEGSTEAQIGCRVHFDVTPKDAQNNHTQVRETPRWTFSPADIAGGIASRTEYTPTVPATGAGTLTAYCEADGIRSNDVRITFR